MLAFEGREDFGGDEIVCFEREAKNSKREILGKGRMLESGERG